MDRLTSRRALLKVASGAAAYGAGVTLVSVAGVVASAQMATPAQAAIVRTTDTAIEAAWARRQAAYAAFNAIPLNDDSSGDPYTPEEERLWAIIDEAEEAIRSTVATTPRGVMLQLWSAMYHSVTGREDDEALTRGDFAAIDRFDSDLDWNARLMLSALRSLQPMGA